MRKDEGFTLIEIMLAITLLGIIMIASLSVLAVAQNSIYNGGKRSQSTYEIQVVAENVMESKNIGAYIGTNPSATQSAITTLNVIFPGVTTLSIPGRTVNILYQDSEITNNLVIYLPN